MSKSHLHKQNIVSIVRWIVAAFVLVSVTLFWWLGHDEILNYQEQYQMFQTTPEYLLSHLTVAGGISAYIAEFLTQFNLYPFVGALFIGLQMVAVMLLVDRLAIAKAKAKVVAMLLGVACVVLLCWMMGDENLLPSFLVAVVLALACLNLIFIPKKKTLRIVATVVVLPLIFWLCADRHYRIPHQFLLAPGFNADKTEVLQYDMLVRQGEWTKIIKKAEQHHPTHPLAIQALNLALAKKQWLGDRMFEFGQIGIEGLMYPWKNNSVDNVISSEVAWNVGFVNTAFRYSFDSQEAIPDKRKSARLTKRMAECCIVNGDYKVARRYLNMLKHTLMYSKWAERAEKVLDDGKPDGKASGTVAGASGTVAGASDKVAMHPIWGVKRSLRPKQEYFFYYPELPKMFALLATESGGKNQIAWDYFNAAALLKGDLQTFVGMSHYSQEMFGKTVLPRHHQEAWAFYWTSANPTFEGIPVVITTEIQQRITTFAQQFMQSKGQFTGFEQAYNDTYWLYFLKMQQKASQKQEPDGMTGATRI